jgi:hypothetical protein
VRFALILLVFLAGPAAARDLVVRDDLPLPRPKPFALRSMHAALLPVPRPALPNVSLATAHPPEVRPLPDLIEEPPTEPAEPPGPSACQLRLGEIAAATPQPPLIGPGECGAVDVVRLEAVLTSNKTRIAIEPPATLRCEMAEAIAHWVREDVVASAASLGAPLTGIENFDSFDCRGRNRVKGAKISEHGKANALDVRALKIGRRSVELTDPAVDHAMRESLRKNACARFTTVLGPGSDGYHENHIHVDIAERRGGYRICQWDVRDPAPAVAEIPLPRARPPGAPARAAHVEDDEPDEP